MVSFGMTNMVSNNNVRSSRLDTTTRAAVMRFCASANTSVAPRRRPTILPVTPSIVAIGAGTPATESTLASHLITPALCWTPLASK